MSSIVLSILFSSSPCFFVRPLKAWTPAAYASIIYHTDRKSKHVFGIILKTVSKPELDEKLAEKRRAKLKVSVEIDLKNH